MEPAQEPMLELEPVQALQLEPERQLERSAVAWPLEPLGRQRQQRQQRLLEMPLQPMQPMQPVQPVRKPPPCCR